jgi:hypothetical protein
LSSNRSTTISQSFGVIPLLREQVYDRVPARAEIKVGAAHKIDRSIFLTHKPHAAETIHAHR